MSVLVDSEILTEIERGSIVISPFDRDCLGTNSYDVHLAPTLLVYEGLLDTEVEPRTSRVDIPQEGIILVPGELYLASTVEHTESHDHVPTINGRSSIGRYGISIHVTAGIGDVGFCGAWTLEIFVVRPVRVRAGIRIGQLMWFTTRADPDVPYNRKRSAKYNASGTFPVASRLYLESQRDGEG